MKRFFFEPTKVLGIAVSLPVYVLLDILFSYSMLGTRRPGLYMLVFALWAITFTGTVYLTIRRNCCRQTIQVALCAICYDIGSN